MAWRNLDVLEAAERARDLTNRLIERYPRRLLNMGQLRDAVQSISANIGEGFGRATRAERDNKLRVAGGEAEEAIRHLNPNYDEGRIRAADYWPLYNLLRVIIKMLNSLRHS